MAFQGPDPAEWRSSHDRDSVWDGFGGATWKRHPNSGSQDPLLPRRMQWDSRGHPVAPREEVEEGRKGARGHSDLGKEHGGDPERRRRRRSRRTEEEGQRVRSSESCQGRQEERKEGREERKGKGGGEEGRVIGVQQHHRSQKIKEKEIWWKKQLEEGVASGVRKDGFGPQATGQKKDPSENEADRQKEQDQEQQFIFELLRRDERRISSRERHSRRPKSSQSYRASWPRHPDSRRGQVDEGKLDRARRSLVRGDWKSPGNLSPIRLDSHVAKAQRRRSSGSDDSGDPSGLHAPGENLRGDGLGNAEIKEHRGSDLRSDVGHGGEIRTSPEFGPADQIPCGDVGSEPGATDGPAGSSRSVAVYQQGMADKWRKREIEIKDRGEGERRQRKEGRSGPEQMNERASRRKSEGSRRSPGEDEKAGHEDLESSKHRNLGTEEHDYMNQKLTNGKGGDYEPSPRFTSSAFGAGTSEAATSSANPNGPSSIPGKKDYCGFTADGGMVEVFGWLGSRFSN